MSTLSNFSIRLKPSKDYFKLGVILLSLGFALSLYSSLGLLSKLLLMVFVVLAFVYLFYQPRPYSKVSSLQYDGKQWLLIDKDGVIQVFDNMSIAFHSPLFFLVFFSKGNKKKPLLIFCDQLSPLERRYMAVRDRTGEKSS